MLYLDSGTYKVLPLDEVELRVKGLDEAKLYQKFMITQGPEIKTIVELSSSVEYRVVQ